MAVVLALPAVLAALLVGGVARAGDPAAGVAEARAANVEGRSKAALRAADESLDDAEEAGAVVPAAVQAGLHCERGVALWLSGDRERAMEAWRQALRVEPELAWPAEHEVLDEPWAAFEALRREVAARPRLSLGLPADLAPGQLWIAGRPADAATTLPAGRYLVQVRCADGEVRGRWWDLGRPPPWGLLCGRPLATGAPVAAPAGGEPTFDDFGRPVSAAPAPSAAPATEPRSGPRGLAVASGSLAAVAGGFSAVVGVGVLTALPAAGRQRPSAALEERGLAPLLPALAASGSTALGFGALALVLAAAGGEHAQADLAGLTVRF